MMAAKVLKKVVKCQKSRSDHCDFTKKYLLITETQLKRKWTKNLKTYSYVSASNSPTHPFETKIIPNCSLGQTFSDVVNSSVQFILHYENIVGTGLRVHTGKSLSEAQILACICPIRAVGRSENPGVWHQIVHWITRKIQAQRMLHTHFFWHLKRFCVHNMCWACIFFVIEWTICCHMMG